MQTQKMSLANIKGKLSRAEMKKIMAGSGGCSVGAMCHVEGGITYTCSAGIGECCCGHSAGNWTCYAP
jgi:hypothetical protein